MKILSSSEAYAYKQQLAVIREQMQQIEERGVYDIAGNIVKPSDKKEYMNLKQMEHHVRQLAAGIEKPSKYSPPKRPGETPKRPPVTDERWKELQKIASEAFAEIRRCIDTPGARNDAEDAIAAQETHKTVGG